MGEVGLGGGRLVRTGQIKKAIGSFSTSNPEAVAATQAGTLEVELIPQGTLAESQWVILEVRRKRYWRKL